MASTKNERLKMIIAHFLERAPLPVQTIANTYLRPLLQQLDQMEEEQIDILVEYFYEMLDFIEGERDEIPNL